jgi:tRNA G26 N,N-dimethylase Trm1
MKPNEIIESIMKEKGISKAQLGRACGIESSDENNKSYQTDIIAKRLKQQKMSVKLFVEMLDAMGYTVIVDQKGKKGEYEVSTE